MNIPKNVTFHITDKCPLHCRHCWVTGVTRSNGLPGVYYIEAARSLARRYGPFALILDGGEAMSRPDIHEIVAAMAKEGIEVRLNTNGYLVTQESAARLIESGVGGVNLSLDGSREVHNRIRDNAKSHGRALAAIGHFRAADPGIDITVLTTLQALNVDDVVPFLEELLTEQPVSGVRLQAISNPRGADADEVFLSDAELWPQEPGRVQEAIDGLIALKERGLNIKNPVTQLRMYSDYFERPLDFTDVTCVPEDAGVVVDAHGEIRFCAHMVSAGSLLRDDIVEALESPWADHIRSHMRDCRRTACHYVLNCFYDVSIHKDGGDA